MSPSFRVVTAGRRSPHAWATITAVLAPLLLGGQTSMAPAHAAARPAQAAQTEISLSASWSGTEFVAAEAATVSGSAQPASLVARVVLQRRTPEGWQRVAAVSPSTARYSLRVPTGWYGTFTYRVKAVAAQGGDGIHSATKRIRVVPPYEPRGSTSAHQLAADPIARWDPCAVIGYRVNTEQAHPGALKDVKGALRRVYQATGLRFAYRGSTSTIPQDFYNSYPDDTDLVFAWAKPFESPLLTMHGDSPMGVGGAAWTFGFRNADGSPASQISSGYVVLDATQQHRLPAGFGRGATRGELLMHEVGHAIGLQHVGDRRQLMYPLMQPGKARWGAGDLTGLAKLGANRGCLS